MRRIAALLVAGGFTLSLAGCALTDDARRVFPARDSDELASGTIAPESTLPAEGSALSGREFRAFNERNTTGRYRTTLDVIQDDRFVGAMEIARDGKQSASRFGEYSFFLLANGDFIVCAEAGSDVECEYDDSITPAITGVTQEVIDQVNDARRTDDRVIVGRITDCVTYSFEIRGRVADVETCLDRETGAMLLQVVEIDSELVIYEATEVGMPSASDFEPPGIPTR